MRCPAPLLVADVVDEDGSVVLALRGELDLATVPVLHHAVDEVLAPHLRAVTLDLADLRFVDVTGLRGFLDVKKRVDGIHAEFRLRSVSDATLRVIRLAGFDELQDEIERV